MKIKKRKRFIKKANYIHNNFYNYRKFIYVSKKVKSIIICPIHGEFNQSPDTHVNKKCKCPLCSRIEGGIKHKIDVKDFISKAYKKHKSFYSITISELKNMTDKIPVVCPNHGEFMIRPYFHVLGGKCPDCNKEDKINKKIANFISISNKIHGGIYGYDKVWFKENKERVTIKCYIHGDFKQIANNHMRGAGCPICASSSNEQLIYNLLKDININFIREYKIEGYKYRYDFYLTDLNLLIEYDGHQHLLAIPTWGGVEGLIERRINDEIKNKLAKEKCIPLKRINYRLPSKIEYFVIEFISEHYPYSYENKFFKTLEELKEYLDILEIVVSDNIVTYKTETNLARYSSNIIT